MTARPLFRNFNATSFVDIVFDYHRLSGGNNTFSKLILLVLTVGRIPEQKEGDANRVRFQTTDNGGPTFTHGLLCDSPAIDQGKNLGGSLTDQRGTGFARIFDDTAKPPATDGDNTDIGAFEAQ